MKHLNPIQVARLLNISDRTVRRHIQKGTIAATRKASGELKIAEDQIEKLRQVLELGDESRPVQVDVSEQVNTLTAKVTDLQDIIARQEHRIAWLEDRLTAMIVNAAMRDARTPVPTATTQNTSPIIEGPQNRVVAPKNPTDLPEGSLHSTEFAESLGLTKTVMQGILKNGIRGEQLERIRIPVAHGHYSNYFTLPQQRKAIEVLRRHGRIKD